MVATENTPYTLALCQMRPGSDKDENFAKAAEKINEAAGNGARMICLPEMWNCPYDHKFFSEFAEIEGGDTYEFMSDLARENEVYLIGGSVPECVSDDGKHGSLYNTSYVFGPDGALIGKHRKMHLFDVNIKSGITYHESKTFTPGDKTTVIDTDFGKIGVAICFDMRFPEMFSEMAARGAHLILVPAAFNMTTGPAHWHLLIRARALDNQLYVAACAPARDTDAPYLSYGHSCIADPWGELCATAATEEATVYGRIDKSFINQIRDELPISSRKAR